MPNPDPAPCVGQIMTIQTTIRTDYASLCIGDVLPLAPRPRRAQEGDASPSWFVLETPPQAEDDAAEWLGCAGVECWAPTETVWRRSPKGPRRMVEVERRILPRFLFARFTGNPQWDVILRSRHVSGFIGCNGQPRPITDSEMMQMDQLPGRLAEARATAAEARRIKPGDMATIMDGAMAGWVVRVTAVSLDVATFVVPLLGDRVTDISLCRLSKTQGLA